MKRDHDEIKIDALFGQIKTPQYDIMKGIQTMNKKTYKRPRFSVAAVCTAVMIFLTAGVVFAAYNAGGFQRLLGIVGEDHGETLTPVEVAVDGQTPFIPGYAQTEDDLRIEIVAINLCENNEFMDIYVTLEDLTGARHNHEFNSLSYVLHTRTNSHLEINVGLEATDHLWGNFTEVIDSANGILTLRTRHELFGRDILIGNGVTMTFLSLMYNSTGYITGHVIPIDLTEIPVNPPTRRIDFPLGFMPYCRITGKDYTYILEPHQLDMPIELHGIHTRVSSIGMVGDNLHVQLYQPRPTYSVFSGLDLRSNVPQQAQPQERSPREPEITPEEEENRERRAERSNPEQRTHANNSLIFNLAPDGTAYQGFFNREAKFPLFSGGFSDNQYQELIWFGVGDQATRADFYLTGIFYNSDSIWLDWTASFNVDTPAPIPNEDGTFG